MIGKIFGVLCIVCPLFALCSHNTQALANGILESIPQAIRLCVTVGGAMCFWGGLMETARQAGTLRILTRWLHPLLCKIFPKTTNNLPALQAIAASLSANFIGLGNAATPFGITAMQAMAKDAPAGIASDDMITFVVLNTAAFSLLPTTLLSIRHAAGSTDPFRILLPSWLCSALSCVCAICICRFAATYSQKRAQHVKRQKISATRA
ncbi:MAG: nucleoside recognition domain-containing protein [Eubacteriales bacterium]|nr:nucleoside recognition domain-containing protein [Eubacteriales bacterium]